MHASGLMGLERGPAACMNYQFTVASQPWRGDLHLPEHRPLAQIKCDAFLCRLTNKDSQNFKVPQNPKNKHRNPIINKVHAPTKVNSCTKYEQNPLNNVGCRVVTRVGQPDKRMDRWRRAWQYPTSQGYHKC